MLLNLLMSEFWQYTMEWGLFLCPFCSPDWQMLVNLICQVLLEKSITLQTLHLYVQPFWEKEGFSCCWLELFYIFISLTTQWSLFQLKKKTNDVTVFSFPFSQDPSCTWTRKEVQWKACSYCCSGRCVIPWPAVLSLHSWYIYYTFGHTVG